jgi:uncharacterized protein YjbI with pentapeptide repeats
MVAYSGAMANPEHLAILKQGVEAWNRWRAEHRDVDPDLGGTFGNPTKLHSSNLREAVFFHAYLDFVDFSRGDLARARFDGAWLRGSSFHSASLQEASFIYTNLVGVKFREADLTGADLTRANCNGADFTDAVLTEAILNETILTNATLAHASGLGACKHGGPSRLDHQTLVKSGHLPLAFLRGCGLPDQFIDYVPSLLNQAIQFYSCFISYSSKDEEPARCLHADLQAAGVRCWFAPHDVKAGRKLHEQVDEAIRLYDRLLLILSDASMASEWVKTEVANARKREIKEKRQVLFPISLVPYDRIKEWKAFDADTGKDSAREIREYFIPDFSNWKDHDSYAAAFQRLLEDLRTEGPNPPPNS